MNLQRGLARLAISAVMTWFVFWTFAYVLDPYSSLKLEVTYADRVTSWEVVAPCLVTAAVMLVWSAAGLRSGYGPPPGRSATTTSPRRGPNFYSSFRDRPKAKARNL